MPRHINEVSDGFLTRLLLMHLRRTLDAAGRSGCRTLDGQLVDLLTEFAPPLPRGAGEYRLEDVLREGERRKMLRSRARYEKRSEAERRKTEGAA